MADISKLQVPIDGVMTEFNIKGSGGSTNYYGTCTGQASNQIKAVTISNDQGFELKTGVLIFVKFDANNAYDASTSSPIQLNVNNTGAKQIYAANTATPTGTNTTYFGRTNYINQYIYNGTYWVWNGSSADNTVNTQVRYADAVNAAAAITASTICVGTSSGYKTAASGITFDISYPILYATSAVSSGSTGTNFYRVVNNRSATSLKSGFSGVAYSTCYLVLSSISGNIATIDSTVYTVTPNVEGKMYIPIGMFFSTTKLDIDLTMSSIYIYEDGGLKLYGSSSGSGLPNEVITYEQFQAKTDEQKASYTGYISGWPGSGGGGGGLLPHLIVISETGSTVTATKGTTVITATETSTGHFECDLTEFGTWTIDAILGGDDAQVSLVVDTVKVYTVDDSHFHGTVTVKYPSGATCRLQSADETLYATGSPYTFTVHHAETYTITVTYNQRIYTDTVTFTTEGQSFSKTLPSPSEIDVVNDIDTWLWYGDVSGTFSSLEEILSNSTALSLLMASTDAVDYLVRSTDWIINKGLVPTMNSDTTPSGVASAGNVYGLNNAYRAFDDDDTTYWYTNVTDSTSWIQYEFENPVCAKRFKALITLSSANTNYCPSGYTLSASNDGVNFTTLKTASITKVTSSFELDVSFENSNLFKYYRILVSNSSSGYGIGQWNRLQFYSKDRITENQSAMSYIGLNNYCTNTLLADADWLDGICNSEYFESVLNVKVPVMTSDTAPSGEAFASGNQGTSYLPYKAFDSDDTTRWSVTGASVLGAYIGYKFATPKKVNKIYTFAPAMNYTTNCEFKVQGSNDDTTWTDVNIITWLAPGREQSFSIQNDNDYLYYRLYCNSSNGMASDSRGTTHYVLFYTLQFYGRVDV